MLAREMVWHVYQSAVKAATTLSTRIALATSQPPTMNLARMRSEDKKNKRSYQSINTETCRDLGRYNRVHVRMMMKMMMMFTTG